jgi:hypothetical protein
MAAVAGAGPGVVQWLQTPEGFKDGIVKPCIWLINCYELSGNSLTDRVSNLRSFARDVKNMINLRGAPLIVNNFINSFFTCVTAPSMQNLDNLLEDFFHLSFPVFHFLDTWNRRIDPISNKVMTFAFRQYVICLAYFSITDIVNNAMNIIAGINVLHNLLDTAKRISNLALACLVIYAPVAPVYFLACTGGDVVFSIASALV